MRELKKASSIWVRDEIDAEKFSWQEGYGAFTVSPSGMSKVRDYIANQEEHHRKRSFLEEFEAMLKKSGVPYDACFLE